MLLGRCGQALGEGPGLPHSLCGPATVQDGVPGAGAGRGG